MAEAVLRSWDFFVIHAATDKQHARGLYTALSRSHSVFLDEKSIAPGTVFTEEMDRALAATRVFVVLISSNLPKSWYGTDEVVTAIQLARKQPTRRAIVPVCVDYSQGQNVERAPYGLRLLQRINFTTLGGWEQVTQDLIGILQRLDDSDDSAAEAPVQAPKHILHAFPRGPALNGDVIKSSIVKEYTRLLRIPAEQVQVVSDAIDMRRDADPDDPNLPLIDMGKLLPPATNPALEYWFKALDEARKQGPRMLAALLLVVDDGLFEAKPKADRKRTLEFLATLAR